MILAVTECKFGTHPAFQIHLPDNDLVRIYRKLEARGEIRGGRFVAGFGGELRRLALSRLAF